MKNLIRSLGRSVAALGLLSSVICLLCLPAQAQVTPLTFKYALSNALYMSNSVYVLPETQVGVRAIEVWQGRGLSVQGLYVGTSLSTTGAIGLGFAVSTDGTNYTSTNQLLWACLAPCGATYTASYTNWGPIILDNARTIKLVSVTNNNAATNLCSWLSNVVVGVKN